MSYNKTYTIDTIAMEALQVLQDEMVFKNLCAVDKTAMYNVQPMGYKVGSVINFMTDPDFEVDTFQSRVNGVWQNEGTNTIRTQPIRTSVRPMEIENLYDVSAAMTAREQALEFPDFTQSVIKPAMIRMAEKIDRYIASKIYQAQGLYASSTLFETSADMAQAKKVAQAQQLGPNKFCLINDELEAMLLGKDWFNNSSSRNSDAILTSGILGRTMGFDFYSTQNWQESTHTNSSGAAVTKAVPATTENMIGTSTLVVVAIAAGKNFSAGDRIKVAGVKRPMIVAANAAEGATTISLVDPICEIIPANAAVTVEGGDTASLTFKGAIMDGRSMAFAMPRLEPAFGGDMASSVVSDQGISIRLVQGYNRDKKINELSIDCLIGAFVLDPRKITLLASK
jgi:hypothetical protein